MSLRISSFARAVRSAPAFRPALCHPCGVVASYPWLRARPSVSVSVSRRLAEDARGSVGNRCDFAHELSLLAGAGCVLSRDARRLVSWWVRAGSPV